MTRIASVILAAFLALSPAQADFGNSHYFNYPLHQTQLPTIIAQATCVSDTTDLTTYTFSAISTGLSDQIVGRVYVGILGEDAATTFSLSSATIEGAAATERTDQGGTGIVNSGFYSSALIQGLGSIDVTVTFSEAVTSAAVCVWVASTPSPIVQVAISDDDTASGGLVLDSSTTNTALAFAVCANSGVADAATWTGMTENQDTQSAEMDYSSASGYVGPGAVTITCDWSGTNDAVGSRTLFTPGD